MAETFGLLLYGFAGAFSLNNILAAVAGILMGIIIGAIPGLGSTTGLSVLLPVTYIMSPATAIIMLAALYYSTMFGGAIAAILINIPGTPTSVITALDGFALAQKGQPGKALSVCFLSSFIGGSIGILILTLSGPVLTRAGLMMGPPELALLIIFAMTSIGWLLGDDVAGGLLATGLGLMFATVGTDVAAGALRFSFRQPSLMAGVSMIPLVVGMYGFAQVIELVVQGDRDSDLKQSIRVKDMLLTKDEWKRILPINLRHGILGCFVGVMPGAGATSATFISYIFEKRLNKKGKEFGTGMIEGCATAEASNNSAAAGAFAPLLTFGIPGSGSTAILLGGLMMWGLRPGPLLFSERPDIVWPLIASFYFVNVLTLIICFASIPLVMKAVSVPNTILAPVIFAICVFAAYCTSFAVFDVYFMMAVGVFSYFLKLAKVSTAPLLLAYVLTPMLERYVRQSFDMTRGNIAIFGRNAICWTLISLTVIFMVAPVLVKLFKNMKDKKSA